MKFQFQFFIFHWYVFKCVSYFSNSFCAYFLFLVKADSHYRSSMAFFSTVISFFLFYFLWCLLPNFMQSFYVMLFDFFKGGSGSTGIGKKKILLLKGKEKEIPNVSVYFSIMMVNVHQEHENKFFFFG